MLEDYCLTPRWLICSILLGSVLFLMLFNIHLKPLGTLEQDVVNILMTSSFIASYLLTPRKQSAILDVAQWAR